MMPLTNSDTTIEIEVPAPRPVRKLLVRPGLWIPLLVLLIWLIVSVFPGLAPYPPDTINASNVLLGPSLQHWFGTDQLGRDIFSRIIWGARDAFIIALGSVILGAIGGAVLGIVGGTGPEAIKWTIMRFTDILLSIPSIVIAMVVITILGAGVPDLILAIGLSEVPIFIRVARGATLTIRERLYIESATVLGAGFTRILVRHILPNIFGSILVVATIDMGGSILAVAGLTFIGLGPPPPQPEWGSMITQAQQYIPQDWWMAVFPGVVIIIAVLALNLLGEELQRLLDPRRR
ncbi:MAG: ABC transporter permease [Bacilli bacterium]